MYLEKVGFVVVKYLVKFIIIVFFFLIVVSCLGFLFCKFFVNLEEEFFMLEKNYFVKNFLIVVWYFLLINFRYVEVILVLMEGRDNNVFF